MSTKIYNGYLIDTSDGRMDQLMTRLQIFAKAVMPVFEQKVAKLLAKMCVEAIDAITISRPVPWLEKDEISGMGVLASAIFSVNRRQGKIRATMHRDVEVDFECTVCVIPTSVPSNEQLLAIIYAEHSEFIASWEATPGVRSFAYWNNTDQPAGVSDEEWARRRDAWDAALGREGVPARVGLTFEPFDPRVPFHLDRDMILSFVTPFDDRCYRVAVEIVRDDWCKPKVDALPKDGFHEAFGILREFHKWVLTPEGVARIEQEIGRVKLILKPEITRDDLETTLPKYAARSK